MRVDVQVLLGPIDAPGVKAVLMGRERVRAEATGVGVDLTAPLAVVDALDPTGRRRDWDRALAPALARSVEGVPRRLLCDIRMWQFLCLVPFRDFVMRRWLGGWDPERGALTSQQLRRFIGSQSNLGFSRNALARIWRAIDILEDPALVDLLLDDQGLFQSVIQRDYGMHPPTARACVSVLAGESEGVQFEVTKRFNMLASTVCIEALDQSQVEAHLRSIRDEVTPSDRT